MINVDKKRFTAKLANDYLAELIEFSQGHTWFTQAVAEDMSEAAGVQYLRQEVAMWLYRDPSKRVEPRLGLGLLLGTIGTKIIDKYNSDETKPANRKK